MSTQTPHNTIPRHLRSQKPEATVLREDIWKRLHIDNEHFIAVIVGREGKGKSGTALSIADFVDPNFSMEQVLFEPVEFLKKLKEWKEEGTTQGRVIVADEAGVGLGNRTWYEKDQIKFAQILQLIRSENMGILFTLPRGTEMDSQVRGGRLHAQFKILNKNEGKYVETQYQRINVGRGVDEEGLWTPNVQLQMDGLRRKVLSLKIGPPREDLWESYVEMKHEFQAKEYQEGIEDMGGDEEDGAATPKEIATEIADGHMEAVVSRHGQNDKPYINGSLIRAEYETSQSDTKSIKSLLERQFSTSELEEYL